MQVVRNELVVALEILISDVEEKRSVFRFNTLLQNCNRPLMPLQQGFQQRRDKRLLQDVRQWLCGKQRNQARDKSVILRRFDDHRQLHRRFSHLTAVFASGYMAPSM